MSPAAPLPPTPTFSKALAVLVGSVAGSACAAAVWVSLPADGYRARAEFETPSSEASAKGLPPARLLFDDQFLTGFQPSDHEAVDLRRLAEHRFLVSVTGADRNQVVDTVRKGLERAFATAAHEAAAEKAERLRRLTALKAGLANRVWAAEETTRRLEQIAADVPPPAPAGSDISPAPPAASDARRAELAAQLLAVDRFTPPPQTPEQAAVHDEPIRRKLALLNDARGRLARTEERVLAGSPILNREQSRVATVERELAAAMARFQTDATKAARAARRQEIVREIDALDARKPPVAPPPTPKPSVGPAADGLTGEAAAAVERERGELGPLRQQLADATRELQRATQTPAEPAVRLVGEPTVEVRVARKSLTAVAGMAAFLVALVGVLLFGRGR